MMIRTLENGEVKDSKNETILTLRGCVKSAPATMGNVLRISRQAARQRIQVLEEDSIVKGYIPIVSSVIFGIPIHVQISIDPTQYKLKQDLDITVESLKRFLLNGVGHAPVSIFLTKQSVDEWVLHCVTLTSDRDILVESLYREENVPREDIRVIEIIDIEGVPMYTQLSLKGVE